MSEVQPNLDRVGIVEASIDFQIGLLGLDEQKQLGERLAGRFGWRKAGDLAVAETTLFRLAEDDYDLTITALGDLGIKSNLPTYEEVAGSVIAAPGETPTYLGKHVDRGDRPELTFHLPITGKLSLAKLIDKFDEKQQISTYIWGDLWKNQIHNQGRQTPNIFHPAIALNDTTDPLMRGSQDSGPANDYNEAGLVYVNEDVETQRNYLAAEARVASDTFIAIEPMSISQYVVLQAKRRQAGQPLLDKQTFTRFVQNPNRTIGGDSFVPRAGVRGDRLFLGGSSVGNAWDRGGVRRVVRVA